MSAGAARIVASAVVALLYASTGCAQAPPTPGATPTVSAADTTGVALIPAGFGTLRQDDISIKLQLSDVLVKLVPLDESVIRTLSQDSYHTLREIADSRRAAIARLAAQHGLQRGSVWYVQFYGLAPEARFSPLELTVTAVGHDYRPVEVLPLTPGFGEQRLKLRDNQSALYMFEDAIDVNQPLVVSLSGQQTSSWSITLQAIERERAQIRSRAQGKAGTLP